MRGAIAQAEALARGAQGLRAAAVREPGQRRGAPRVDRAGDPRADARAALVHAVVSGVGTGGTMVGLYEAFAEAGCPVVPFVARPIIGS